MSFKIVVDGEVVHEIDDRRVTKVRVLTRAGEAATVGIDPEQTELVLAFDYANPHEINLVDLDRFKLGYGANLTEDDINDRQEQLESVRGKTNEGEDIFTNEAKERAAKAEEEAKQAEQETPVNPLEDEHAQGPVEADEPDTDLGDSHSDGGADENVPAFALAPDSGVAVDKDLATPGDEPA
jgi:hypothetical protein